MPDAPILPDDDSYFPPTMPTAHGGGPDSLGRIDHYDVLRKLGGGGFGVVYLARDTASGVEVAIKTLHPLLKHDAEEMDNLREKFKLVHGLTHPNIAKALVLHPVRDAAVRDETARRELNLSPGDPVMVMDYAPGVTLSKWRRQFPDGVVPVDLALEIGRQVAAALDYAHGERIVHRDVKPGNIMVETLGGASRPGEPQSPDAAARRDASPHRIRVRILDFGLAAEIRSTMARVSSEKGDTSGTRPYMAPEQWLGRKQDGRTDQYALACVLYELLSGEPPFAGAFDTGDPVIMMSAVENRKPDPVESLDASRNAALLKGLAKKPNERFESCGALLRAVETGIAPAEEKVETSVLRLSASVRGESAPGAECSVWGQTFPLPAKLRIDLGSTFGPADVSFEDASGRRYAGRLDPVSVDWRGEKSVVVSLEEIREELSAEVLDSPESSGDATAGASGPGGFARPSDAGGPPEKNGRKGRRRRTPVSAFLLPGGKVDKGRFDETSDKGHRHRLPWIAAVSAALVVVGFLALRSQGPQSGDVSNRPVEPVLQNHEDVSDEDASSFETSEFAMGDSHSADARDSKDKAGSLDEPAMQSPKDTGVATNEFSGMRAEWSFRSSQSSLSRTSSHPSSIRSSKPSNSLSEDASRLSIPPEGASLAELEDTRALLESRRTFLVNQGYAETDPERAPVEEALAAIGEQIDEALEEASRRARADAVAERRAAAQRAADIRSLKDLKSAVANQVAALDTTWNDGVFEEKRKAIAGAQKELAECTGADSLEHARMLRVEIYDAVEWIKVNTPLRDKIDAIENEFIDLTNECEQAEASVLAATSFRKAERMFRTAGSNCADGLFEDAISSFASAKELYVQARDEARSAKAEAEIESAKIYMAKQMWEECLNSSKKALEWNPNDSLASEIRDDALQHLNPKLTVTVKLGNNNVTGAVWKLGAKTFTLPKKFDLSKVAAFGPANVFYEANETKYIGYFPPIDVEWRGPNSYSVVLCERDPLSYTPRSEATTLFPRWLDEAKNGDFRSCILVARCYAVGYGTEPNKEKAIEWLRAVDAKTVQLAEEGDAAAQYTMGLRFGEGLINRQNDAKAFEWYQKSAEQGYAGAQNNLANLLLEDEVVEVVIEEVANDGDGEAVGAGVETFDADIVKDDKQALFWRRMAAEQGLDISQYLMGQMYEFGTGVEKSIQQAVLWYKKAASQGHLPALCRLGAFYYYDEEGNQDYQRAAAYFLKAAEQGNAYSQLHIGFLYENGLGVKQNLKKALEWYLKAAKQGDAEAQFSVALSYYNGIGVAKDFKQAAFWFAKAAEQGHAGAQNDLGVMYSHGMGVNLDFNKAFALFQKSAQQGEAYGQVNLGYAYANGDGVVQDARQAVKWYQLSAEQGNAEAQFCLGKAYYAGFGVGKSITKAVEWVRKAADQGHSEAQYIMGRAYEFGQGVPKNNQVADEWYTKAAQSGNEKARGRLGRVRESDDDLIELIAEEEDFGDWSF